MLYIWETLFYIRNAFFVYDVEYDDRPCFLVYIMMFNFLVIIYVTFENCENRSM